MPVWLFSNPLTAWPEQGRVPAQERASQWLLEAHGDDWRERFNRERQYFAADPHLALNWLLLASVLNERVFVDETIASAPKNSALFTAFEQLFGNLSLDNTPAALKAMLPGFDQRRARLLAHFGKSTAAPVPAAARLTASLLLDPAGDVYDRVSHLAGAARAAAEPLDALSQSFAEPATCPMPLSCGSCENRSFAR